MSGIQGRLRRPVDDTDHSIGPANAPITLVEYGDFECPYCYRAHPIVLRLRKELGEQLRFVFRNFPLTEMHPRALPAAVAAESVAAHAGADAYWRMHDAIYEHQQDGPDALDDEHLIEYAESAGADGAQVQRDLDEHNFEEAIRAEFMGGIRSGVNGTPTFFINGVRYEGDWTRVREFAAALRDAAAAGVV